MKCQNLSHSMRAAPWADDAEVLLVFDGVEGKSMLVCSSCITAFGSYDRILNFDEWGQEKG